MVRMYPLIMSKRGMVTSPHYLASLSGAKVLMGGGNAVDAAIATNATLGVVYPHMCGLGGDIFMLIFDAKSGKLRALNGSGRSPRRATIDFFLNHGMKTIPTRGILSVTVPGVVDGWCEALDRYGTISLTELLKPAISYAEGGFPITEKLSHRMEESLPILSSNPTTARTFLKDGRPFGPGEVLMQRNLAKSLRTIASGGRDEFYRGELGSAIAKFSQENGGLMDEEDLKRHHSDWVEPISTNYRGFDIYALPPNTQGIATLLELNIVEGFNLADLGLQTAECIHILVEAKKVAFADRDRYVSDPEFVPVDLRSLLSKDYADTRRNLINLHKASQGSYPSGQSFGDTVYVAVVDGNGNAVSLIQSIYYAFGSGVVAGDTGIILHNRGAYFSLDSRHPNRLQPLKRTFHTLSPLMIFKEDSPVIVFGTSGADGQPQTHLQVLTNIIDFGMDIQQAIEAPRWLSGRRLIGEPLDTLRVEGRISESVLQALRAKGHKVEVVEDYSHQMGNAQGININQDTKVMVGGVDPRGDGIVVGL